MTNEQKSANSQTTDETEAGYAIPARRVTWLRIHLLILLAAATATLAILLSGDPASRPLWLILMVVAIVVCCLLLIYALSKAITPPPDHPQPTGQMTTAELLAEAEQAREAREARRERRNTEPQFPYPDPNRWTQEE
ncbi:MAG TPA: hypothetical protein VFU63_08020 [Ktedonobacterales bacterium]|nr:hypothetical protein [Ktedonobacterales bacterium]